MRNIAYETEQIGKYYSSNRVKWSHFYPSERWVFERVASEHKFGDVLDIGCACCGLGMALNEKFRLNSYTGIDINKSAIEWVLDNKYKNEDKASFNLRGFSRRKDKRSV